MDYYGISPSSDFFAHYGVKGMKWGVRKYIDKNGNLTKAAMKRYGKSPLKNTSARKMARDFNRLDQSVSNKLADYKEKSQHQMNILKDFMYSHPDSKFTSEQIGKDYENQRIGERIEKLNKTLSDYKKQMHGMAKLQEQIIKQSKRQKTNNKVSAVTRHGVPYSQVKLHRALNVMLPIPGMSYGLTRSLEKGKATAESVHDRVGAEMSVKKKKSR